MNDLIDSNGSRGKVLIMKWAIKWYAYCVDKLNDTWLQSHKTR